MARKTTITGSAGHCPDIIIQFRLVPVVRWHRMWPWFDYLPNGVTTSQEAGDYHTKTP